MIFLDLHKAYVRDCTSLPNRTMLHVLPPWHHGNRISRKWGDMS